MKKLSLLLLMMGATIFAQAQLLPPGTGIDPTDPNDSGNYAISYVSEGEDWVKSFIYLNGQVVETNDRVVWGSMGPAMATNETHLSKTVSMKSEGTVTIKVTWIGTPSAAPEVVGLAIYSPASTGTNYGFVRGEVDNGIGSPAEFGQNGLYTPLCKIRVVSLGGGTGQITLHKRAYAERGGIGVDVSAAANGVLAQIDNRWVSINGINGAWPTVGKNTQMIPTSRTTSDGVVHSYQYMGRVAENAKVSYGSFASNSSAWEIGLPICTQTIEHFVVGNTITTPEELNPRAISLQGGIGFGVLGQQTPNSYKWSGSGRFNDDASGSLPSNGSWDINGAAMQIFPDALIKETWQQMNGAPTVKMSKHSLMANESATYKLEFSFHDGIVAESERKVTYRKAAVPTLVDGMLDHNTQGAWIPIALKPAAASDAFAVPGYATKGHASWPTTISVPNHKVLYGNEAISMVAAKYVGLITEEFGAALGSIFSYLAKRLSSFINASYPPPFDYDIQRDEWVNPNNEFVIETPDWYEWLTGDTNPPANPNVALRNNIQHFHWKVDYRPTYNKNLYTLDHYDGVGFKHRDLGDEEIENDIRASSKRYFFRIFKTAGGNG